MSTAINWAACLKADKQVNAHFAFSNAHLNFSRVSKYSDFYAMVLEIRGLVQTHGFGVDSSETNFVSDFAYTLFAINFCEKNSFLP